MLKRTPSTSSLWARPPDAKLTVNSARRTAGRGVRATGGRSDARRTAGRGVSANGGRPDARRHRDHHRNTRTHHSGVGRGRGGGGGSLASVTKSELLANLRDQTYARIQVSSIPGAGVGVVAIRDIPAGTDPFALPGDRCRGYTSIQLSRKEVDSLASPVRKLITDFVAPNPDGSRGVPSWGFNAMDIAFYMNNDDNDPNISIHRVGCMFLGFRAKRKIPAGTELFIRYKDYDSF